MSSVSPQAAALLELVAAVGGTYAFYKLVGPFLYNECFASVDESDDELRMAEAGLLAPPTERSPLLPGASPRPNSVRLAMQMYDAHLQQQQHGQAQAQHQIRSPKPTAPSSSASSIAGGRTPAATHSGRTTPVSTAPSTPVSHSSSYFDLKHPPLYVSDVSHALERESIKRRNSNELPAANFLSGFAMTPNAEGARTPRTPGTAAGLPLPFTMTSMNGGSAQPLTMNKRRFSGGVMMTSNKQRPFAEDTSFLTAALVCLLHCPDLNEFFLSGKYLDEDVEDKQHQAIINAFASVAHFFWSQSSPKPTSSSPASLDLSIFQTLLKNAGFSSSSTSTSSPAALRSSSQSSRSSSPGPRSSSPARTLVDTPYNLSTTSTSTTNGNGNGAQLVTLLLHSLHVALNEGEYTAVQPSFLRTPFRLGTSVGAQRERERRRSSVSYPASTSKTDVNVGEDESDDGDDDAEDGGLRRHAGFLRNMKLIQEDSVVRDLFEGSCCVKTRCEGCDETTVTFESFLVLNLPPTTSTNARRKPSLTSLLREFERPSAPILRYCSDCRTFQPQTETRKLWSLPSVLVFSLAPNTSSSTTTSSNPTSTSAPASSSPMKLMRSFSSSTSSTNTNSPTPNSNVALPPTSSSNSNSRSSALGGVDYPLRGLNMSHFDGERSSTSSASSTSAIAIRNAAAMHSVDDYDLSSESGDSADEDEVESDENSSGTKMSYDLFAVRECVMARNGNGNGTASGGGGGGGGVPSKYRSFTREPSGVEGGWSVFDAATGAGRSLRDSREVVTSNADLLFYRRREVVHV